MIDKEKIANTINTILDTGLELLNKDNFEQVDHAKLKTIRSMGSFVNSAVMMSQQELGYERIKVIRERMAQLGYQDKPAIEG